MQISIRELKADPGRAIALMRQSERVQITSYRKVVAELVPPKAAEAVKIPLPDEEGVQRLIDLGIIVLPAAKPMNPGKAIVFTPGPGGQTKSDLLLALRQPKPLPQQLPAGC